MPFRARMDHVGLHTLDLERSIRWYHHVLGLRLSDYLPPGNTREPVAPHGIAWMRYGPFHHDLTLVQVPPEAAADAGGRPSSLQQLAFHVASEEAVEVAYRAVQAAGVPIVSPLKRGPVLGVLQFYMGDPDGNKIEIFHTPGLPPQRPRAVPGEGLIQVEFLSHIGVWTRDMERAIAWYQEMLGFRLADKRGANPPEERLPRHGIAWLSNSAEHHNLVLVQLPPGVRDRPLPFGGRGTLQQIAFAVDSRELLLEAHEFLAANGADIIQAPRPQNWSGGMKFYFRDPDGNKLEIEWGMKVVPPEYGSQYEIAQRAAAGAIS